MAGATLALVIEEPRYGAQIASAYQERYGSLLRSQSGHIYAAIRKLREEGLIELMSLDDADVRGTPQPKVPYRATPRGAQRFKDWVLAPAVDGITDVVIRIASTPDPEILRPLLEDYERIARREARLLPTDSPHLGGQLALDEAKALLDARITFVRRAIERLDNAQSDR